MYTCNVATYISVYNYVGRQLPEWHNKNVKSIEETFELTGNSLGLNFCECFEATRVDRNTNSNHVSTHICTFCIHKWMYMHTVQIQFNTLS